MTTRQYLTTIFICSSLYSFGQENVKNVYSIEFPWQTELTKKEKKTIEDYFLLLPSDFIDCEGIYEGYPTREKREKLIQKKDVRNGYIEFQKTAQLALFKDKVNSKDIVAIQIGRCGAGSTCGSLNTLLELKDNKWIYRVDLLPKRERMEDIYNRLEKEDKCPYFDLPQIGTVISVRDENNNGAIITSYRWTGTNFQITNER